MTARMSALRYARALLDVALAEADPVVVEQARREIDSRLMLAERELVARTADLAVGIAAKRVKAAITAEDQARLVDQYLGQLAAAPAAGGRVTA